MSSQTIYIKIDKNVLVHNRNITLGDIAKIECTDVGICLLYTSDAADEL